jgi:hypothetical protein
VGFGKDFSILPLGQNHKNRFFHDKPPRGFKREKKHHLPFRGVSPIQKVVKNGNVFLE